ncbi:NAD-dependent epimerase/dehydratase family protein [candidate division WOR-3 bacterium]|nr:NAD-dependent epimerase/dehydratase family protein [candidate division WOR-3 bacterium]
MKIAVFGASGFVGRNVIETLKEANMEIIVSDIKEVKNGGVDFIKADLLNYNEVSKVVKGSDIVVHLAASPLPISIEKPKLNARINIEGTLNIMDAAREHGIDKIIFSSASSLVGDVKNNLVDERHPCSPKTPYAVAKYAIEHYLRVYQELYGLDYLVFRFFNIYGQYQYPESGGLIPMVYRKLTTEGSFNVFGDGSQTRDFVYVGDVAKFYLKAIKKDIKNEVVNLGTGKGATIKEVVKVSGEVLGIEPKINYLPLRAGEIGNFVADTGKLKKLFGSVPETELWDGLRETFEWLIGGK